MKAIEAANVIDEPFVEYRAELQTVKAENAELRKALGEAKDLLSQASFPDSYHLLKERIEKVLTF